MKEENKIILYQDDNEITRVSVRFADEDVWLTQNQLAEIYDTTQENISMHISNIYKDGELDENRTYKKFLLVRQEGNRQVKRTEPVGFGFFGVAVSFAKTVFIRVICTYKYYSISTASIPSKVILTGLMKPFSSNSILSMHT